MPDYSKLEAALKLVTASPYAEAAGAKLRGALGELWQGLAGTKGFFATGPDATAGGALADINARHGVRVSPLDTGDGLGLGYVSRPATGDGAAYMQDHGTLQDLISNALDTGDTRMAGIYGQMIKRGSLNPQTQMYSMDSQSLGHGTGGAKNAVPALYDKLMTMPDAANFPFSGLSENNVPRKSMAMAQVMEKYGEPGANRILAHPSQLAQNLDVGNALLGPYAGLPLEQKQGLMAALSVTRSLNNVNGSLKALNNAHLNGSPHTGPLMTEANSLGVNGGWNPSTDVDPDYFNRLTGLLRSASSITGTPQGVGVDGLRRTAITADGLTQGLQAGDLRGQDFLTQGISRSSGGTIPGNTPGALTQTSGCAG